tara:strand:+ start:2167 stop:2868 length:702 start_codon:yes stop_codon:yes gene_type:complete
MTAFEQAWDLLKMGWRVYNPRRTRWNPRKWHHLGHDLYSGGTSDHWTPVLEEALGYAMFGSAVPKRQFGYQHQATMPMKAGIPKIRVARDERHWKDNPIMVADHTAGGPDYPIGEPTGASLMPDDEMRALIERLLDDRRHYYEVDGIKSRLSTRRMWKDNTSAFGNTDEDIEEHMRGALRRLESGIDETQPLPEELREYVSTSELEPVKRYTQAQMQEEWDDDLANDRIRWKQ